MSSEADMEKEFSKNIDRLLSGEEMESTHMSDDYLSALDFAQKLVTLRDNPSPFYTAQLKVKLLLELQEKEARISRESRGNWWPGTVPFKGFPSRQSPSISPSPTMSGG